jgi:hypothetical protein
LHRAESNGTVKNRIFRDCGVAEAPPGFQAGCSDSFYFFLTSSILLAENPDERAR